VAERKVEIRVGVEDTDANARLDSLASKLDKLTKRTWTIKLRLDDGGAIARLDKLAARIDKLSKQTISPKFDLRGLKTANTQLDRLTRDRTINVKVNTSSNIAGNAAAGAAARAARGGGGGRTDGGPGTGWLTLLGLLGIGKGGGGGGGLASLIGQGAGMGGGPAATAGRFAASPVGAGAILAGLGPIASLIDVFAGMGVGAAGAGGAYGLVSKFKPSVLAPGMTHIDTTLSTVAQAIGPSVGMMLSDFAGKVQGLAPMLAKMFTAALPFIREFLILLEQAAKTVLPAFTQVMKQMVSSGALKIFTEGLIILIKGFAQFLVALGPGFKAGAETFRAIAMGISGLLDGLGHTFGWLGKQTGLAYTQIHDWWDKLRHNSAVIFDGIRHETAHVWDDIYKNTIGKVVEIYRDSLSWEMKMRHDISTNYDILRHYVAYEWDQIWSDTIGKVQRGVATVEKWFRGLPSSIRSLLSGLGKMLLGIGTGAMNEFWAGLKNVGGSILGWIKNFFAGIPHDIMSLLHMSPPHPGSAFYDLGANFMHHLEAGMQSRASKVASAMHGIVGGSAGSAQRIAQSMLGRYGWGSQWGALNAVAMRESGWNMNARNPSSGAYGIAQFINGPSEYYQYGGNPGSASGQVTAFLNYIKQRYGSPNAAWAHELNFGWYDKGGPLKQGLTLALNTTGHEEMIVNPRSPLSGGGGGGDVYNIMVQGDTDPDGAALRIIQKVRKYKMRHGNAVLGIA
jgi:hypothetical protein